MNRLLGIVTVTVVVGSGICRAAEPPVADAGSDTGAALYARNCAICHAAGGTGTLMLGRRLAPDQSPMLADRRELTPSYIESVVRAGIGSMPWFTRVALTDPDLRAIIDYLRR
jgi:mono/diheme cytochrome c family protein